MVKQKNIWMLAILGVALAAMFFASTEYGADFFNRLSGKSAPHGGIRPVEESTAGAKLEVYFIDIGQGDAELVRIPKAEGGYFTMLIDSGEYKEYMNLKPFLESLNVTHIDALVASHPHADHIGAMANVIEDFEVGAFYMAPVDEALTPITRSYEKLLDALLKKNLKITPLTAGMKLPGAETIEVLGPVAGAKYDNLNNYSIMLKLVYGKNSFLFSGDTELNGFASCMEAGADLKAEVLKASHHGSTDAVSAEVLKAITPKTVVISCGAGNEYGHPSGTALGLFETIGSAVHRTDLEGTIIALADGKSPVQFIAEFE